MITIQNRLLVPTSAPWAPGTPAIQVQPEDFISIALSKKMQVYPARWQPDGSSLTVIGGEVNDIDYWRVLSTVSVPTGDTNLLIRFSTWPLHDFSYIGDALWALDDQLIFSLTTYSCTDNCRPIHINPGNNNYIYTPLNQT
jgi:hypothetical protein